MNDTPPLCLLYYSVDKQEGPDASLKKLKDVKFKKC